MSDFTYFAAQGAVPVRTAAILIRPDGQAVVSLDGPYQVPRRGFAHIRSFAKDVVSSLELRLNGLIAEERDWARLSA